MLTKNNEIDIVKCSKRLRDLRTQRGLSHAKLATKINVSEQVLKNYEQAYLNNGKATDSPSDKTKAIAGMSIKTLYQLARYYNVSADYLLGLSPTPSTDKELSSVCKYIGLSETATSKLHQINTIKRDVISKILESYEFEDIVNLIISAQYNKELLKPSGDVIAHIITDKLVGTNKTKIEKVVDQFAEQVAQRGLTPFYKQEIIDNITTIFDTLIKDVK